MTIIAVKDGILAADTGVFAGGLISGTARKWAPVPEHKGGGFVAGSGSLAKAQRAITEMAGDNQCDPEADAMIWLDSSGRVLEKYGEDDWLEYDAPFHAIGSGAEVALGAMAAGASAKEAVKIAIQLCVECGGRAEVAK